MCSSDLEGFIEEKHLSQEQDTQDEENEKIHTLAKFSFEFSFNADKRWKMDEWATTRAFSFV